MASRRIIATAASQRILYAGDGVTLPGLLKDSLKGFDCFLVRSPVATARTLLKSDIKYTLLLFDGTAAGAELERFTRTLTHREHTPIILVKKSGDSGRLLETIRRRVGTSRAPKRLSIRKLSRLHSSHG
jgi:hypothetical protein